MPTGASDARLRQQPASSASEATPFPPLTPVAAPGETALEHVANALQMLGGILETIPAKYLEPGREVNGLVSYQALVAIRLRLRLAHQQLHELERRTFLAIDGSDAL